MNKNVEVLGSLMRYCRLHPEERFWQALRNWSGHAFIFAGDVRQWDGTFTSDHLEDTFGWETRDGRP
jgi:hypothetical protein